MAPTLDAALDELYRVPPDEFVAKRTELADGLKQAGETTSATAVRRARKPTMAAWTVNALALDDRSVAEQLTELGARLRTAQDALDADELRTLSTERQRLVARLAQRAVELAGRREPPAALLDEVRGTLSAAVADADIAGHLGRLTRAEQYSGFGFLAGSGDGAPQLTLVRGGRSDDEGPAAPKETAAQRRKRQRLIQTARDEFDRTEAAVAELQTAVTDAEQRTKELDRQLSQLRAELDETKARLADARNELTAKKKERQQARRKLDRAERGAE
jgi:septal ring factor EnvC (AmiA/AmiB activator)